MKELREKVLAVSKIAKECPENLQQQCFTILLNYLLGEEESKSRTPGGKSVVVKDKEVKDGEKRDNGGAGAQDDLVPSDLHVKTRRFLQKYGLNIDHLNGLFYKENNEIKTLYDDLNTTKTSENQIRITMLQCLHNAIRSGEFETTVEKARLEAQARKCYDTNNWSAYFTNNAAYFNFEKYSRAIDKIGLGEDGKEKLAAIVQELQ